ncbi:hypothetical protein APTSU1_001318300 [Apodemus speciosus]|uniref:Uncharacterized protein n=1 Tax=Apodemus speciosus TaxID=105296 RepID=A0ABQ0FF98_APOSI
MCEEPHWESSRKTAEVVYLLSADADELVITADVDELVIIADADELVSSFMVIPHGHCSTSTHIIPPAATGSRCGPSSSL